MKEDKTKTRESNIDLLKVLAIIGVIILHYNNRTFGAGFIYVDKVNINYFVMLVLEGMALCSVNIFILITGYFLFSQKSRTVAKPVNLIIEVLFISLCAYCIFDYYRLDTKYINDVIHTYWFVFLYISLYFISPFINVVINHLNCKQRIILIAVMMTMYSIEPFIVDIANNNSFTGLHFLSFISNSLDSSEMSIVHFILMYTLGAIIRCEKHRITNIPIAKLIAGYIVCVFLVCIMQLNLGDITYFYRNPIIISEAVCLFLAFLRLEITSNKIISLFSQTTFTVYLIHNYFLLLFDISRFVNGNTFVYIFHTLLSSILVFLICAVIHELYVLISKPINAIVKKFLSRFSYQISD